MNDDMLHAGALVVCGSTARGKSNRRAALSSPTITVHHTSYITTVYIYCWWNLVGPDPPPLRSVSNNPTWSMHVYGTYPGTVHLMGVQNGADVKYIHYTYIHTYILYCTYCTCVYVCIVVENLDRIPSSSVVVTVAQCRGALNQRPAPPHASAATTSSNFFHAR
jgi:hypothetical protein